jgi:bifunctional non-homologous end joining protein LigD
MMQFPVLPMLATSAQPFDSAEHLYEVKWDGVRALAAVTADHWQVWGRECADYTARYPELEVLRRLPAGTIVDGELIVLRDGLPDLPAILRRHPLVRPDQIRHASRLDPVRYMLFDLLAWRGRSLLGEPLSCRRAALAELGAGLTESVVAISEGVIGAGKDFFARVVQQGHEGVVAKHLASVYHPGKRSSAWRKIKPVHILPCVIIGYTAGPQGMESLVVAAVWEGCLRYAATLKRGLGRLATESARRLASLARAQPIVPCPDSAVWIDPVQYCQVRFRSRMRDGRLQDAVFVSFLESEPAANRQRNRRRP